MALPALCCKFAISLPFREGDSTYVIPLLIGLIT
jgi:hypothetical protein